MALADLTERAAAQSHFRDLCDLLGEEPPTDADPKGEWYAFEKGATKTTGGEGWADVWKRGCFGWEYKGKRQGPEGSLRAASTVCAGARKPALAGRLRPRAFEIHTNWTNTVSQPTSSPLTTSPTARKLRWLKWAFTDPEQLKPGQTRQTLTEQAAAEFARLAQRLRDRGHPSQIGRPFHQPAGLLHVRRRCRPAAGQDVRADARQRGSLTGRLRGAGLVLVRGHEEPADGSGSSVSIGSTAGCSTMTRIAVDQATILRWCATPARDWAEIDPSIFGTLFERGLDPDKRSHWRALHRSRQDHADRRPGYHPALAGGMGGDAR